MSPDYSDPAIRLSKAQALPDVHLPWIPDIPVLHHSKLSQHVLERIREAILAKIPTWISAPNRVTKNLPDIQTVLLADIATFESTIQWLKKWWKWDRVMNYENARTSIKLWGLQILLAEYWRLWDMDFLEEDIVFFRNNDDYHWILEEMFWEIILNDFQTSWNAEISTKVVARKILSIENAFWLEIKLPEVIHPNLRNLIEVELELLWKATSA